MNVKKIQKALIKNELDAILLVSPQNRRYACDFASSEGAVLITGQSAHLFVDGRYHEAALAKARDVSVSLFSRANPLGQQIKDAISADNCRRVGAEERALSYDEYLTYEKTLGIKLVPTQGVMTSLRAQKEAYEVQRIVAAQRISERALEETLPFILPGVSERDIAAELSYRMLRLGAEGNSFDPICITGAKTSMPHGVPSDEKIKSGDFFTMDFGCVKDGYCSDMTRTVAVGSATAEMKKVYDTVLRAQLAGIEAVREGVAAYSVHNAAMSLIARDGYGEYFTHSFGHGIGLDVHESPSASPASSAPLPCGAVISAEPGIYLPGRFGVRIEDMLLISENGCENLTNSPKELIIL